MGQFARKRSINHSPLEVGKNLKDLILTKVVRPGLIVWEYSNLTMYIAGVKLKDNS
jgi:hypothetical protein